MNEWPKSMVADVDSGGKVFTHAMPTKVDPHDLTRELYEAGRGHFSARHYIDTPAGAKASRKLLEALARYEKEVGK